MKRMRKLCKCCRKRLIIAFGVTKYCSNCSLMVGDLIAKIHHLKNKTKNVDKLQQENKRLRLLLNIEEKRNENR